MNPDAINAGYEFLGGVMLWRNVMQLHRDKRVRGVSILTTGFFATWGVWNLYYYPFLGQWLSLAGGICLSAAQLVWIGQMLYYGRGTE